MIRILMMMPPCGQRACGQRAWSPMMRATTRAWTFRPTRAAATTKRNYRCTRECAGALRWYLPFVDAMDICRCTKHVC